MALLAELAGRNVKNALSGARVAPNETAATTYRYKPLNLAK